MRILIFVLIVCILLVAGFFINNLSGAVTKNTSPKVIKIIDGDTVVLDNEEHVRLLNIDTPEKGQQFFAEARDFLKTLVENKAVVLEKDEVEKDKYGRTLAHVYLDNVFVNLEIVKAGYAKVLIIEPNVKYEDMFLAAEQSAKENGLGIWALNISGEEQCLGISYFHSNAKGNDNENLNDEYVILRNKCNVSLDITDYLVKDAGKNQYKFRDFILGPKQTATIYTGQGTDNKTAVFWGSKIAVWNNNNDSFYLYDPKGNLVLNYSYGG